MNNTMLYGLPNGALFGQNDRVEDLNKRIYNRNIPDNALAANFDPRPVSTKYDHFSIIDRRKPSTVEIEKTVAHNVQSHFNPGTHRAPPLSILRDVNIETVLRNQTTALQHGSEQSVFVPSSSSDLYKVNVASSSTGDGTYTHPHLFHSNNFMNKRAQQISNSAIGKDPFLNNTRVQLRNM